MAPRFEVISGRVTNPSTTITALTADTGDSFTVKNFLSGNAWILNAWAKEHTLGILRVRSSLLHDISQAIRLRVPLIDKCRPLLPLDHRQALQAQDNLTVEMSGDAAATDAASLLVYYENGPGGADSFITDTELAARRLQTVGLEVPVTSGATAGQYGGSVAINSGAAANILKANTAYAIVGYLTDTELVTIGVTSPDFGNTRVGGPGSTDAFVTRDWFDHLAEEQGLPLIPVFNSANAGNTNLDVIDTATGTTINVTLILEQLSGAPPAPSAA